MSTITQQLATVHASKRLERLTQSMLERRVTRGYELDDSALLLQALSLTMAGPQLVAELVAHDFAGGRLARRFAEVQALAGWKSAR